jgi:preprotein translocase subunit SecG
MTAVISILIILICILLVLAVLIQNPKGGGLASGFTSGAQVMGVRRTADFLEKATWGLAVALLVLSIFSASLSSGSRVGGEGGTSTTKDRAADFNNQAPAAQPQPQQPAAPAPQPAPQPK